MAIKQLQKIKEHYILIISIVGIITSVFMYTHNTINRINDLIETTKTTQQMSLKAVIWSDSIPLVERSSACDVYLSAGYNSMTKKECEVIIEKASEQGVFE